MGMKYVRVVSGEVLVTLEDGTQVLGALAPEDGRPRLSEWLLRAMQGPRFVSAGAGAGDNNE